MTDRQKNAIESLLNQINTEINRVITYKEMPNGAVEFYAHCHLRGTDEHREEFITFSPDADTAISALADVFRFACIASYPETTIEDEDGSVHAAWYDDGK